MKEATIHFTEEGGAYIFTGDDPDIGFITTHPSHITNTRADLLKKRLEAVIQKEAEEMYPYEKYEVKTEEEIRIVAEHNVRQTGFRIAHREVWQSLLSRLPSEEEMRGVVFKAKTPSKKHKYDTWQSDAFIDGANWLKSKLLPSLPSSLMCEYSEENGKIEVKKIWV